MMKRYKLLKDLPNLKKGTILSEGKPIFGIRTLITKNNDVDTTFIDNELFEEFFEEIKEPTDSIHWEPLPGDIYWYLSNMGYVLKKRWMSSPDDIRRHRIGNTYRTEKECEKARDRKLAEATLRRTSTFKPDLENEYFDVWYIVNYNHIDKKLQTWGTRNDNSSEPVRYETREEAEKSIKENREDWLIYFGIEAGK